MADTAPQNEHLEAALGYAHRGWRVVPIVPGEKRPPLGRWVEVATSDPERIAEWWAGRYEGFGVGIVCGWDADRTECLFVVDIDEGHATGVSGSDTIATLEEIHGTLPATLEVLTGSGGRHLYFTSPIEIRNDAGRHLGAGVDIRGEGGQVLAPPTVHPNGRRYEVEASSPSYVTVAPAWLIDLLNPPAPEPRPAPSAAPTSDRPGDRWAAETTWAQLLTADGWTLHHVDREGEEHWTRPGKELRDGTSATVGYKGSDVLKVFTSSIPALNAEETYTKLGYLASTRHGGDHRRAAQDLAAAGWGGGATPDLATMLDMGARDARDGEELPADGWEIATGDDIRSVLTGTWEPPIPTILCRRDGAALLYPGKVHSLAGEPGAGKTWIALAAVAQVLADGERTMVIDHEDRLDTTVRRLAQLGVPPELIVAGLDYVTPTIAIRGGGVTKNVVMASERCTLVVVDSLGEALAHSQLNQNDDGEVAGYMGRVARRLADGGAAVLLLDHVVKSSEERGRWSIGSQRKLAAIDGAAYQAIAIRSPSVDAEGLVKVVCSKDRGGNWAHGSTVAEVTITPGVDGSVVLRIDAMTTDSDGEVVPTTLMEKVSEYLQGLDEAVSIRRICDHVEGKMTYLRKACQHLIDGGHMVRDGGTDSRPLYVLSQPFTLDLDSVFVQTTAYENGRDDIRTGRVPSRPVASRDATPPSQSVVEIASPPVGDAIENDESGPTPPTPNPRGRVPDATRPPDDPDDYLI